jgi:preprotein translocase subunit YajC
MTLNDWFIQATFLLVLFNLVMVTLCYRKMNRLSTRMTRLYNRVRKNEDVYWVSLNGKDPFCHRKTTTTDV